MTNPERTPVIAGNWKMYKTIPEALDFIEKLVPRIEGAAAKVYIAVPFTVIAPAVEKAKDTMITIGAQNMNDASEGAFTGEIAAKMLVDAGAKFVILGHSERRRLFSESSSFVSKKVRRALQSGLQPIVCVGESLEERKANKAEELVRDQLLETLDGVSRDELAQMIIAYEPVWAIGTGENADPEQAQDMHYFCRKVLADKWGEKVAQEVIIQYGGSVKPENAKAYMSQPDIDGLLVGGASLNVESFSKIVNYQ
jgi:triosephosphate isomerase